MHFAPCVMPTLSTLTVASSSTGAGFESSTWLAYYGSSAATTSRMLSAHELFLNGQIPADEAPRSYEGCSSRLHTDTRLLQLGMSEVAREDGSLDQLRGPPAMSLSPPFFSVTVSEDEEEKHVIKGLALLIDLGLSFADGLWRLKLRLVGLGLWTGLVEDGAC